MATGAPTETGTPIRYPSAALLCVDSEDTKRFNAQGFRIDTNVPSEIYVNQQRPLMFGYMTRVALTEVQFQWNTPNINPRNSTLTLSLYDVLSASPYTATYVGTIRIDLCPTPSEFPGFFYTLAELCNEIQLQLNDLYATVFGKSYEWTVSASETTCSATIDVSYSGAPGASIAAFKIMPANVYYQDGVGGIVLPAGTTVYEKVQDDLTTPLGFQAVESQTYYTSLKSGYSPMQYTPYVDIVSNILTKNQNVHDDDSSKSGTPNLLARLYLSNENIVNRTIDIAVGSDNAIGCRPFVFRREFKYPKQIAWNTTENIDVIDLQVLDYLGNPLYITPNEASAQYVSPGGNLLAIEGQNGNTSDFQFTVQVSEV